MFSPLLGGRGPCGAWGVCCRLAVGFNALLLFACLQSLT